MTSSPPHLPVAEPEGTIGNGAIWRRLALPLTLTLSVQIAANVALLSVAVLAPVIGPDVGVTAEWIGFYIAIAYATGAATSLASSRIIAPLGPMTASLLAMVLTALGLWLATVGTLAGLALAAVPIGLAYGLTNPTSSEILAAVAPARLHARVFSLKQTAVPGGGLLAGLACPPLAANLGWAATLQLLALVIALAAIAFLPFRRSLDRLATGRSDRPAKASTWRILRPGSGLRPLALACFCLAGVQLTVTSFFVAFCVEEVGMPLALAGTLFAVLQAVGVPARVAWGWLADAKVGNRRGLAWQAGLTLLGIGALSLAEPDWPLWALAAIAILLGLSIMAWTGLMIAAAVASAPGQPGPATAAIMTFAFSGVVTVPPLVTLATQWAGTYTAGFALAGGFAVLALGLVLWARYQALRAATVAPSGSMR